MKELIPIIECYDGFHDEAYDKKFQKRKHRAIIYIAVFITQ